MAECKMMRFRINSIRSRAILVWMVSSFSLVSATAQVLGPSEQARTHSATDQPNLMIPKLVLPVGNLRTATETQVNRENLQAPVKRSNPLWAKSLASLAATRERPIFSALRRPRIVPAPAPINFQPSSASFIPSFLEIKESVGA
jgi:hypothetical protein